MFGSMRCVSSMINCIKPIVRVATAGPVRTAAAGGPPRKGGFTQHRGLSSSGGGGGSGGGGIKSTGGNGSNGSGGGQPWGLEALWVAYLKALETSPWKTKIATSAALNGLGDVLGQSIFEKDKAFDWIRFAKFVFLGGALVAPVLNVWYSNLYRLVPAQNTAGAIGRLALDQLVFAPCFVSLFISSLFVLDGNASQVPAKLKQDLVESVIMNWKIWIPAQFINFRFVPPQLNLLMTNFTALIWNAYLSWASTKAVEPVAAPVIV